MDDLLDLPDPTGREPLVATLVLEGGNQFEVSIAADVFGIRRGEILRHPAVEHWYDFRLCAPEAGMSWDTPGGGRISIPNGLETIAEADVVVVPLCARAPDTERRDVCDRAPLPVPEPVREALRAAHDRGATLLSFCSGAFALAEAGVLDGRRATTHWMFGAAFRRQFPRVEFVEDVLYVDEGDVMTSAGSAAGLDLTLHFIRREHGTDVADMLARRLVVPPHRDGGQAQYASTPLAEVGDSSLAEVLDWVASNLDRDLRVEDLARRAAMSPRSFARHFRQATGATPHQWLTARRVDHARRLLETTDLSVDRVAAAAGLGTATNLRLRLRDTLGVTPTDYRRRFARSA